MAKTVALVGHCGPDSSFLKLAIKKAAGDVKIVNTDDEKLLQQTLDDGAALVLFNRVLDFGFEESEGVPLIRRLKAQHPGVPMMLVSNYEAAQAAAREAGAVEGFGKNELGGDRVKTLLADALSD